MSDWRDEMGEALKDIKALTNAAADQASAMSDEQLGRALLEGRWTTLEVHEAGRRLLAGRRT